MNQQFKIRRSPGFIFSYFWLAGEVMLIGSLFQFFLPHQPLFFAVFLLLFARLYYWLNFTAETKVQSMLLVGLSLIIFIISAIGVQSEPIYYAFSFVPACNFTGFLRITFTRYSLNQLSLDEWFFGHRRYPLNVADHITIHQHKRGEMLNFGCLIIPVLSQQEVSVNQLFFGQRKQYLYKNKFRLDGVLNPGRTFNELKTFLNNEK